MSKKEEQFQPEATGTPWYSEELASDRWPVVIETMTTDLSEDEMELDTGLAEDSDV